jgi:linoleoyl-CoA desaturase
MAKVSFSNKGQEFFISLKKTVDQYFTDNSIKKTGDWRLYIKAFIFIPLAVAIYFFLLYGNYPALAGMLLSAVFGIVLSCIAFNVMHDANHGSFSSRKWVNELMGYTMNILGSDAYIWKMKHNILHHTYTNVDGLDDDMTKSPILRMSPTQRWVPAHRFQYIYMFVIYAVSTILWVFLTDMAKYFTRKIIVTEMKLTAKEHIIFWISKVFYVAVYMVIPAVILGWQTWLVGYLILNVTMGITFAFVFQTAHIVEITEFENAGEMPKVIGDEWAIHELKTTANFAMKNKVVSWLVGGLNFQVEHHLFTRVSHVHYPAISKIVQEHCAKYNVPYLYFNTMTGAVMSHIRLMKQLGNEVLPAKNIKHGELAA